VTECEVIVLKSLEGFKKIKENKKYFFFDFFFQKFSFKKITEITCADGIAVSMARHGRRPIAIPTTGPVLTAIWPVSTPV
jgi:hypothetical protein